MLYTKNHMYFTQGLENVLEGFQTSEQGLTIDEATVRLRTYGYNELPKKKKSLILLFLSQFNDVMVFILLGALAISSVMPFFEGHDIHVESFIDAYVILAILILNSVLGFVQEYKAEEAISMLEKLTSPHTRVRRSGQEMIIPSREVVPGDVVIIEAGDKISADGRVFNESHLRVNESSLTGESMAVDKCTDALRGELSIADQRNMVFSGTIVTNGSAEYVVTATGLQTEIGKIAKLVSETQLPETPLQRKMERLGKLIGIVVIGICVTVFLEGLYEGIAFGEILLLGVSLAVSAVPEGLPAVVTVCFAMGVRRMVKQNALVRRLDALETLGSVDVICADKTGTITQNKMTVVDSWVRMESDALLLAEIAASCNRAQLPNIGDPTEIGLLEFAAQEKAARLPIDDEPVPFSSEEKYMKTKHGNRYFLKGAPERITTFCPDVSDEDLLEKNTEFAKKGLRVLACAVEENDKTHFVGLIAMEDPPRPTVQASIQEAKNAGVRTMMITGDNVETALAIARHVGIIGEAIEGKELDSLTPAALCKVVETTSVYARVSPEHKLQILLALQQNGHVVAMSGDGVNDAPALKGAHVGIAMGKVGTEVAREASSIVLADDNYSTIVSAIREGRRIYDNIKKFVIFLLRANFDELLLFLTVVALNIPLPYLPIHILWINLMTDGLPALALGMEKAEPDIMKRKPRSPGEHLLHGEWGRLVIAGLLAYAAALILFLYELSIGNPVEEARTVTLVMAILFELLLAFNIRSTRPIWEIGFFTNRYLLGAAAVPLILNILLIYTPLHDVFQLYPLPPIDWIRAFGIAVGCVTFLELLKLTPIYKNTKVKETP